MLFAVNSRSMSTARIARSYPDRMNIKDIRHQNLLALSRELGGLRDMARRSSSALDANYLSQLKNRSREMGDSYARKIEESLSLPAGWMDHQHQVPSTQVGAGPPGREAASAMDNIGPAAATGLVPLVSWVRAGEFAEAIDAFEPGDSDTWIRTYSRLSTHAFALEVRGDSMVNPWGRPSFPPGTIIIVDPEVGADAGKFVIAKLEGDDEATFKKLVREAGDRLYLQPLNPSYPMIPVDRPMLVVGVVVRIAEQDL